MSDTLDLWIKEAKKDKDGLILKTLRLSTFEEVEYHFNSDERGQFKTACENLTIPIRTIEALEHTVLTFSDTKPPLPIRYVGNMLTDIIIDIHEPDNIIQILGTEPVALYAGDYMFITKKGKLVLIERKRLENGELLNVITKKKDAIETKLTSQAKKMSSVADISILLIDLGYFRVDKKSGRTILPKSGKRNKNGKRDPVFRWRWADIQKNLISIYDRWHILPWFSYDNSHVGNDLIELRAYLDKDKHTSQTMTYRPVIVTDDVSYPPEVLALCATAGVGPLLADRALRKFGSIKTAVNATIEEWKSIEGFGDIKSKMIVNALEKEVYERELAATV